MGEIDPSALHEVSRRLQGLLRARGASSWLAEDLTQETLTRAVAHRVTGTDADDLMRWCVPVARNLLVDHARHARWTDESEPVPDVVAPVDVERQVLARLELGVVLRELGTLPDHDRQAVLDGVTGVTHATGRKEAVGEAVRRHRARQRLARLVAGAAAVWGWLVHSRPSRTVLIVAVPAALSTLLVLPAITTLAPTPPGRSVTTEALPVAALTTTVAVARAGSGVGAVAAARVPQTGRPAGLPREAARTAVIEQQLPTGLGVAVGTSERPEDRALVCVEDVPLVADTCLSPDGPPGERAQRRPSAAAASTSPQP